MLNICSLWDRPLTCVRMSVQELQRDIQQHTEGVESVLSLCDMLLRDEDAAGATELEGDSLQETSRSLDQRWRTICTLALDRRLRWGQQITSQHSSAVCHRVLEAGEGFRSSLHLKAQAVTSSSTCLLRRIEETWRLWCKFLDDYSQFEDWLKTTERTAANPNSADVLYTVAKEELKKFEVGRNNTRSAHTGLFQFPALCLTCFVLDIWIIFTMMEVIKYSMTPENPSLADQHIKTLPDLFILQGFQRQVHERLMHLELVNNQYRRLARENRTDRAGQLKLMVHEGNRRWDMLHRRVAAIVRRLKVNGRTDGRTEGHTDFSHISSRSFSPPRPAFHQPEGRV